MGSSKPKLKRIMQKFWCALFLCFGLAVATDPLFCTTVKKLTAVDLSYKSHEDHILYGQLAACPSPGLSLTSQTKFQITSNNDQVTLVNDHTGEFVFRPTKDFSGIESFYYVVEDYQEGQLVTSETAKVLISLRAVADVPHLSVESISGVPNKFYDLNIKASLLDKDGSEELKVTLCNCNERPKCSITAERCECELTLPGGWEFQTRLMLLRKEDLQNLLPYQAQGLTLSTFSTVSADKCISVFAISMDRQGHMGQHSMNRKQLNISIHHSSQMVDQIFVMPQHPAPIATPEGRPVLLNDIRISQVKAAAAYQVNVRVDQGGTLWVRKNIDDVIFHPKDFMAKNNTNTLLENRELDRDESFYDYYTPYDTTESNNGKRVLEFTGSLSGVNEVLSTLVFVPWCPKWPVPPNWNLPESSWMVATEWDQVLPGDPRHPAIWPQWYPRFWYPFPESSWTWWPRVWAPYWLNQVCSDWTSRISVRVQEVKPANMCQSKNRVTTNVGEWSTDINVWARTAPKSLIARSLFSYFNEESDSVMMRGLYIRSLEADNFKLKFHLSTPNSELAYVLSSITGHDNFTCEDLNTCNQLLASIRVYFKEGVSTNICSLPVVVKMYKDESSRLGDMIYLWAYKTTPECVDVYKSTEDFAVDTEDVQITQGETGALKVKPTHTQSSQVEGIIHAKISAEHGLVSFNSPDGLRVYFDHMGIQNERLPTKLCVSGPAHMVLQALSTARFTPLKDFLGQTTVTITFGMPTTASNLAYGYSLPKRKLEISVTVVEGQRPTLPLLSMPQKFCVSEMDFEQEIPLDMIMIQDRFHQGHVQITLTPDRGTIHSNLQSEHLSDVTIRSTSSGGLSISCPVNTISPLFLEGIFTLAPTSCTGSTPQSHKINVMMTSLGQSMDQVMVVEVQCGSPSSSPASPSLGEICSEEDSRWSEWSQCLADECQTGLQWRQRLCGSPRRQERSCISCNCQPLSSKLRNPSLEMRGCTSLNPISRCPPTCQPIKISLQVQEFECLADGLTPGQEPEVMISSDLEEAKLYDLSSVKVTDVEVHHACACQTCTSRRNQAKSVLPF